jgi:hypothetical protein
MDTDDFAGPQEVPVPGNVMMVVDLLEPISNGSIDRNELGLVIDGYPDLNPVLEAMRLAQWAERKNERLDFPVRALQAWLAKSEIAVAQQKARSTQKAPSPQKRDPLDAPVQLRVGWLRSNVQDFVHRTAFLQESYGSWEREENEKDASYQDRLQPYRRVMLRGDEVRCALIEGNRWTVGLPVDLEWETAEYEQAERKRLQLPLLTEVELRTRFTHLGTIGPKDREHTLLLPVA